ncbi:MAG: aldehyde ferredoxin oxidoreductase family protein [Chloroflexi bacterium]|nr:aldehyde ferredoxin oxidoreductase family protein [Chloroflexota bacterium]MCL5026951.1 aldehyde ferredoxin oxidoreductase family protein [Chloroflexota bacterium]
MEGYSGKILRVDLTTGKTAEAALPPETARAYIGGLGLATKLFVDSVSPKVDPLGPENKIVFAAGPLAGTGFPTASTYGVCTKSPETGIWTGGTCSGFWGGNLKAAGYDALIVEGKSDKPVYISIGPNGVEIHSAEAIWGKDTFETQAAIAEELGGRTRVSAIGPAGEKQVPIATIQNNEGGLPTRGGIGAVMGSKNLKAIAVRGTKRTAVADSGKARDLNSFWTHRMATYRMLTPLANVGPSQWMDTAWYRGEIPLRNWQMAAGAEDCAPLGTPSYEAVLGDPREACDRCPIRCVRQVTVVEETYSVDGPGPDHEAIAGFGPLVGNRDLKVAIRANDMCARLGLDPISTAGAIAFAMEAFEKGAVSKAEAGRDLSWGNPAAIIGLIEDIGEAKGLGATLGQGVKKAAAAIGKGSEAYAVHVKGLEPPMHDPRSYFSQASAYATGPSGASWEHGLPMRFEQDYNVSEAGITGRLGRTEQKNKALAVKAAQDLAEAVNSLAICSHTWTGIHPWHMAELLRVTTGFDYDSAEVLQVGERVINTVRQFNLGAGVTGADDTLPARLLEPRANEPETKKPDLARQLKEYYELRGWTADGIPTKEKLEELGIA